MKSIVLSLILAFTSIALADDNEFLFKGTKTIDLFHSFGSNGWKPRGQITIKSGVLSSIRPFTIEPDDLEQLKDLSDDLNNEYRIKGSVSGQEDAPFVSFTRACTIVSSSLSDVITVVQARDGSILGLAITGTHPTCDSGVNPVSRSFNTSVSLSSPMVGPVPDTATYIQRMEHEKMEKLKGGNGENKSFLAKYWMYILIGVIMLVVSSAAAPEEGR